MNAPSCKLLYLYLLFAVFLVVPIVTRADDAVPEIMTNQMVLDLYQMQLGEEVIIEKIKNSSSSFDVSMDGLKQLKQAGISANVMSEMIRVSNKKTEPIGILPDPNDFGVPQEPGLYYYDETVQPPQFVKMEPTVYKASKSGGFLAYALTSGISKIKTKAVLANNKARLQLATGKPTFYFRFEVKGSGIAYGMPYFSGAVSPSEFIWAKTEIKKKTRELVVGSFSAFSAENGVQGKSIIAFDFEQISPGVYKVFPKNPLLGGEYCFFYGGAASADRVFDFGAPRYAPPPTTTPTKTEESKP